MNKNHRRQLLKNILIISLILSVSVVFMLPVRKYISHEITNQKIELLNKFEKAIGYNITYSSISPSVLHAFEIRNLKIYAPGSPSEYLVEVERLRLRFNLFDLNLKNPVEAFSGILIVNSRIKYNKEKNKEILKLLGRISNDNNKKLDFKLNPNFAIRGKNISLEFENNSLKTVLQKAFFTIKPDNSDFTFSMQADSTFVIKNIPQNNFIDTLNLDAQLRVSGRIQSDLKIFDLDVKTVNLVSDIIAVKKLGFNIIYNTAGKITVIKTGDNIPVDLNIGIDTNKAVYSVGFNCQDFVFNDYFESKKLESRYKVLTKALVSGTASLEMTNDEISYNGDLRIKNLRDLHEDFNNINLSAKFQGDNNKLQIKRSSIIADSSKMEFYGGIVFRQDQLPLVNGSLKIPSLEYRDYNLSSDLSIKSSQTEGYQIITDNIKLNDLSLKDLLVEITPFRNSLEYHFKTSVFNNDISSGIILSDGSLQLDDEYYIQSSVMADNLVLKPLLENLQKKINMPDLFNNFELSTELFVSGTLKRLSFASTNVKIADPLSEDRNLSFSISGNNSGFRIGDMHLQWGENNLNGRLTSKRTVSGALILDTNLQFNGVPLNASGVYDRLGNVSFAGDYDLKFYIYNTITKRKRFNLSISKLPVNISEKYIFTLSTGMSGYFKQLDDWKVLIEDLSIASLETGYGNGNINFSAELNPLGSKIYELRYSDQQTELIGDGEISISSLENFPEGTLYLEIADDESKGDEMESYEVLLAIEKETMYGFVNFNNLPLDRIKTNIGLSGELTGILNIGGTLNNPQLNFELNTQNGELLNHRFTIDTRMLFNNNKFYCQKLEAEYNKYKIERFSGSFDATEGNSLFKGKFSSSMELLNLISDFNLNIDTETTDLSIKNINSVFKNVNVNLNINNILFNGQRKTPWSLNFSKKGDDLSFVGGANKEIKGSYLKEGHFSLSSSSPFPLQLSASGRIFDNKIDIKAKDISFRANNLRINNFNFISGLLTGEVNISGAINDPDFYGQIDVKDLVMKAPIAEDASLPTNGSFFISGKNLSLPYTRIKTDNGIVNLKLDVIMERWLPRNYSINLQVDDDNAVSAKFLKSPFYSEGFVSGNVKIFGNFNDLNVSGDITCSNTVLMINSSLDFPISSGSKLNFNADLKVRVGDNDQFYWPTKDLPILSGFLQRGNSVDIKYNSIDGLNITGQLPLSGGEIFYFERNFYLKEGYVKFVNDAKEKIDPLLSARAVIREVSSKSEVTKIYLILDEAPLSKFSPRFVSDSQLSTSEIIRILGGNIFGDTSKDTFDWKDAALLTSDVLTQFFVMRRIEEELKGFLHLDLLSIRSSFFSNFLDYNVLNFSNAMQNNMLSKYLDNTTLFLGKYITDEIFLQGTFEFDLYSNKGYSDNMKLNLNSEVTLEWEAPIANFEISLFPDFLDPVEGLTKTSIGLSWHLLF